MDIFNRPPDLNVEIFGCANEYKENKEKVKCTEILVPYKAEFDRRGHKYILYTKCPKCKARYKFSLRWDEKKKWMKSLKYIYLNCFHCGSDKIDVLEVRGENIYFLKIRCNSCGKTFSKIYRKVLVNQLEADDVIDVDAEEKDTGSDLDPGDALIIDVGDQYDERDKDQADDDIEIKIIGIEDEKGEKTAFKVPVICPACKYEINEEFKGYCPGCGNRFSIRD